MIFKNRYFCETITFNGKIVYYGEICSERHIISYIYHVSRFPTMKVRY